MAVNRMPVACIKDSVEACPTDVAQGPRIRSVRADDEELAWFFVSVSVIASLVHADEPTANDPLHAKVLRLVQGLTSESTGQASVDQLVALGLTGVPYSVSELGDERKLPDTAINFRNWPGPML